MALYQAYGLKFASALSFPELLPGSGKADVFIDVRDPDCAATGEPSPIVCIAVSPCQTRLKWARVGELWIEDGNRITVVPAAGAEDAALRLFVLGAGFGVLLHQRDLLVFHASGVVMQDGVAGFFGGKGWGKSTMAAALHRRGHPLISDELLAVRFDSEERPWVLPGSPQIRLWSDALANGGAQPGSGVRVRQGIDKFSIGAEASVAKPHVFHCAYLLDAGPQPSIVPEPPSQAFLGLVPHLYVSRFGTDFLAASGGARCFRQLTTFVHKTSVKRLKRRRDLSKLPQLAQLIERDIEQDCRVGP